MSADNETLRVYDARVADYVGMISETEPNRDLPVFLRNIPPGGHVLDLGCGPGQAAARMRDLGYRVTAWDASPKMAEIARDLYGLEVVVASFDALEDEAAFDGVWANFSLLHAPKADMPAHLAAIHRALKPGGWLSVGLKTGTGEARDGLGRFYAYYSDAEITGLLQEAGFTVAGRRTGTEAGLSGSVDPWIVLTAHA
ncbi:MAG: class I SAM-dependent methyltransferase [Rhodobacter sp.]|nr:class I SAM-dependent methyltransferase [Rhodobacter sp.]